MSAIARYPAMDDTLTIVPDRCSRMIGRTACVTRNVPVRLIRSTASQSATDRLGQVPPGHVDPGAVDQHVHAAPSLPHLDDEALDRVRVGHVGRDGERRPARPRSTWRRALPAARPAGRRPRPRAPSRASASAVASPMPDPPAGRRRRPARSACPCALRPLSLDRWTGARAAAEPSRRTTCLSLCAATSIASHSSVRAADCTRNPASGLGIDVGRTLRRRGRPA